MNTLSYGYRHWQLCRLRAWQIWDNLNQSTQCFPAPLNSSLSDSEKCCYSNVKCRSDCTTVLPNSVGILICYANDWCLMHNQFSVTQMVSWQQIGCYKIALSELKTTVCMNGFHMNGANAEWENRVFIFRWTGLCSQQQLHYRITFNKALWHCPTQTSSPVSSTMNREQQRKWQSRYRTSRGLHTHELPSGTFIKDFQISCEFSKCRNYIQSANSIVLSPKNKKKKEKKILDKLNKAICSVDQSQPVRFACRWAHAIRAIHWLARQPVAMATWRWRRAEWGVVGGIKWRRERMLPPTPYYSDLV